VVGGVSMAWCSGLGGPGRVAYSGGADKALSEDEAEAAILS
jgi:hypothetical protein